MHPLLQKLKDVFRRRGKTLDPRHLSTERFELVVPATEQSAAILAVLRQIYQDPAMMEHLGGPLPDEELTAMMERWRQHWQRHGFGSYVVRQKSTAEWVAQVKLLYLDFEGQPAIEIGWMVLPKFQRQRVATETMQALVRYARTAHPTLPIVAFPDEANVASNRICEKLGMVRGKTFSWEWLGRTLTSVLWRIG